MGFGQEKVWVMGYGVHFLANQVGGCKMLWVLRGYGLRSRGVRLYRLVSSQFIDKMLLKKEIYISIAYLGFPAQGLGTYYRHRCLGWAVAGPSRALATLNAARQCRILRFNLTFFLRHLTGLHGCKNSRMAALVVFPSVFNFCDGHTRFKTRATRASFSITYRCKQACHSNRSFNQFGPFESRLSFVQDSHTKSWYALVVAWTRIYLTNPTAETQNNTLVRNYIVSTLKALNWHIELDEFSDSTPIGPKRFANIIATKDPNASRRVVLSAHFDSKYYPNSPQNQVRLFALIKRQC